jgi:RNA-directed DNA polymerase
MEYRNLMGVILSRQNMMHAYGRVVRNGGAAGVDGMGVKQLSGHLREHWSRISTELLEGRYRPAAVRGVEIPKASGGKRLLGIPTVMDRLIQQAVHQVLSPLWEPEFSTYSYGFRPVRSAKHALDQATEYINAGYQDVIDLDLKSFFDRVNHDKLMSLIRKKIKDKALLRLIRLYLQSGILLGGVVQEREEGTPQGGPLSPLLSNILLNELDSELTKRGHRFVRYADDCSIFLRSKRAAERVLGSITRFLEDKLLLEVNREKTKICRPVHFVLLGHTFTSTYKRGEKGIYRLSIARKSWESLKRKIKALTRKTDPIPLLERIARLNSLMNGWVNYFKYATGYEKFDRLDGWIRNRLRYCIWKSWKRPWRRYRAFRQMGVTHAWAMRYAFSRKGGWRLSCSPVMGMTVTEERLKQRGYRSFKDYYHHVRPKMSAP